MLRKLLFWLHLTTGAVTGVVVLMMSVTGVALTYQKQMNEWADRAYWPGEPGTGSTLYVDELVSRVAKDYPDSSPTHIRFFSDTEAPAVVTTSGGSVFVNRYTGETNNERAETIRQFFRVMTDWHRWIADDSRTWGPAITGASNFAFLFIVFSGMYLWLPRRWNLSSLRAVTWFKGGLSGKARDFNWHNVFGFWTATIKAKWMKAVNMTSSFSNLEKMRRNPLSRRNNRSTSLRLLYIRGRIPRDRADWILAAQPV